MTIHDAKGYRETVTALLSDGWAFASLHASAEGGLVNTLLLAPSGDARIESVVVRDGSAPTIVDLANAAGWDEREAHDLYGVRFAGHEPLRPLVDHDPDLARWTTHVRGHDAYQVAVGPIHAGVIESGHFRFHLVGDRILHLDPRLFYKHRGLERAAEGATLEGGLAYAARACAACAVSNGLAYAHACEDALGLDPTPQLSRVRTILLELERVWSHLHDIAAVCAGVGLAAGNTYFASLTERARRVNAELAGHRFLFGAIRLGGSSLAADAHAVRDARERLAAIGSAARRGWRELIFNASFVDRLTDIGVVTTADAVRLGAVGPAARASGLVEDTRIVRARLAYSGFTPQLVERAAGDVQARLEQRHLELHESLAIVDALLEGPIEPSTTVRGGRARSAGLGMVESPRGRTVCVVERSGERVSRVRLRTGSYANWPVVAHAAADGLLPDFPLVNKSFELCYACADR